MKGSHKNRPDKETFYEKYIGHAWQEPYIEAMDKWADTQEQELREVLAGKSDRKKIMVPTFEIGKSYHWISIEEVLGDVESDHEG